MKRLTLLFLLSLLLFGFSSCALQQLMKSGDIDTQYDTALRFYKQKKYHKAYTLFDNVLANIAGTTREDTLLFYMGKCAYSLKNYATAAETFDTYRKRFARTAFLEEAEYLHAMCYYNDSRSVEKDQTETHQAILAFNEYLNRYPESQYAETVKGYIEELQSKVYDKLYVNSSLYHKLGSYNAAITSMKDVIKEHPDIPQKEQMMFLICKSWYNYAENSIFARQLDRYMKTIDSYFNYLTYYPESTTYRAELDKMYERAKEFTDKFGYKAQKAEMNANSISSRKKHIEECKERIFTVDTKQERQDLRETIKSEKKAIKEQQRIIREDEKEYRSDVKLKKQMEKNVQAETKATKTASGMEKDLQKQLRKEEKTEKQAEKKQNRKTAKSE